ncbi:MAG: hypothetical protein HKN05_23305 [Rhizobiales bacterium]|nr:hypothetical protein [Hyphomicrobiales bacterium]
MGLPVLHGVEGESAEIVEINRIGLPFQPENSADLTHKLLKLNQNIDLRNQLRTNCLKAAPLYDRTRLAREMLATLGQCVELSAKEAGENANTERGRRAAELHEGRAHH